MSFLLYCSRNTNVVLHATIQYQIDICWRYQDLLGTDHAFGVVFVSPRSTNRLHATSETTKSIAKKTISSKNCSTVRYILNTHHGSHLNHSHFVPLSVFPSVKVHTMCEMPTENHIHRLDTTSETVRFSFGVFFLRFMRSAIING